MNEFETTIHLMMLNHVSYEDLANKMGQPNGGNLYKALNKNKNIYVSSLRKILDALGYELIIREKNGGNKEYVIAEDSVQSPLRFRGMNLNLEAVLNGTPRHFHKSGSLTLGERRIQSEKLRKTAREFGFYECDKQLREIWDIKSVSSNGTQPYCEYMPEYEEYKKEFAKLCEWE